MNKTRAFVAGAVVLVVAATYAIAFAAGAVQSIAFDTPTADAGVVREGHVSRVRFRFKNRGIAPATIEAVTHSCGLMTSFQTRHSLNPGQEGEIAVDLDTKGRSGLITGTVDVTVKDPLERTVSLAVATTIDPEFTLEPQLLDFGDIVSGTSAGREIVVRMARTTSQLVSARVTDEHFEAHLSPNDSAKVVVSMKASDTRGVRFGTVRIVTSSPDMPELIVPIRARVIS